MDEDEEDPPFDDPVVTSVLLVWLGCVVVVEDGLDVLGVVVFVVLDEEDELVDDVVELPVSDEPWDTP